MEEFGRSTTLELIIVWWVIYIGWYVNLLVGPTLAVDVGVSVGVNEAHS
jgi:hypothetical protein